ncbi:WD40 repeat [Fusarium oxysporum f. sp. vasinfectum]|uniref:NACHT domain-containing protein n=1 Tax=Fusarium oxysporum f. sp. vasinfectum 25433 TaxID=1089449 RepID=X0L3I5_FUSOX|nr:hypothetical protein FOTG_11744 [Fusarium oxysporum f. sp. vasinfectum 25433]KAK2681846.1 WD40 repeat [Fusarium oxysporum f. sp. vasinfectum]
MENKPSISVQSLTAAESSRVHVGNNYSITNYFGQDEINKYLDALRSTDPREDKERIEQTNGGLLKDSYAWIVKNPDFVSWRDDQNTRLLWIRGDPGKGKTMLMSGIINELQPTTRLESPENCISLSYFFCQATNSGLDNYTSILQGLVYLLVTQQPSLVSHLKDRHGPNTNHWNSRITLEKVFRSILADAAIREIYLLVDALDECLEDLPSLLMLISSTCSHAKWIVSSRNRHEIKEFLEPSPSRISVSLELNESSVSKAVESYISYRTGILVDRKKLKPQVERQIHDHLSENAEGTFLWVALVCQQLERCRPWEIGTTLRRFPKGLNELYARMMNQISMSDSYELYIRLLAIASTVFRPITFSEIMAIEDLNLEEELLPTAIAECGSFLTTKKKTILFIHQSAKDFLIKESSILLFPSGLNKHHRNLFESCVTALQCLHKDMYRLVYPGVSVQEAFKNRPDPDPLDHLKYACSFWNDHLKEAHRLHTEDGRQCEVFCTEAAFDFIAVKFLFWLEALSLCGNLRAAADALLFLKSLPTASSQSNHLAFTEDGLRFFYSFGPIINDYPLQTYTSGLLFSPKGSLVRHRFEHLTPAIFSAIPEFDGNWSPISSTFKIPDLEHKADTEVRIMNFSLTSQMLVIATHDSRSVVWRVMDEPIPRFIKHKGMIWPTPSPDGKWLAVIELATYDHQKTIQLYDLSLKSIIWTWKFGQCEVLGMDFSPDSRRLAVCSNEELVLYDLKTGVSRKWPVELDYNYIAYSVSFSSDYALVAFQFHLWEDTETIWLLDLETGTQYEKAYNEHRDQIYDAKFIPGTHSLLVCTYEKAIYKWDYFEHKYEEWSRFDHETRFLAFSYSESWMVIGNYSEAFLYDRDQLTLLQSLRLPTQESLCRISVSFDDQKIALCAESEIWIVDVPALFVSQTSSMQGEYGKLRVSDNGRRIVYELGDRIEVWDVTTRSILSSLAKSNVVHGASWDMAISPGGQHLAFVDSSSVSTWNLVNNELQKLSIHDSTGKQLAISDKIGNEGPWVAVSESPSVVAVWNLTKSKPKISIETPDIEQSVASLAFSSDHLGVVWGKWGQSHDAILTLYQIRTRRKVYALAGCPSLWHARFRLSLSGKWAIFESCTYDPSIICYWRTEPFAVQFHMDAGHFFFLDDSTLSTSRGIRHLDTIRADERRVTTLIGDKWPQERRRILERDAIRQTFESYGRSIDGAWITLDSKPLLWLPAAHRSERVIVGHDHIILIGTSAILPICFTKEAKECLRQCFRKLSV